MKFKGAILRIENKIKFVKCEKLNLFECLLQTSTGKLSKHDTEFYKKTLMFIVIIISISLMYH